MEQLLQELQARLANLKTGYEQQKANIFAQEGAIQECEAWINRITLSIAEIKPQTIPQEIPEIVEATQEG